MRKLFSLMGGLAVAGAALIGSSAAMADGMPGKAKGKAIYEPVPYHTWGGLYFGASLGGQWSDVNGRYVTPPFETNNHNTNPDSGIYGVHVGIQHQMGAIVVGVEAGFSGTGLHHSWNDGQSLSPSGACIASAAGRACQSHVDAIFTIGPRLGWAVNPSWLLYTTAGYASGNVRTRTMLSDGSLSSYGSERHDGWFVGAGVEWAITPNWIFGVEYQHIALDTEIHRTTNVVDWRRVDADTDIVRARLSFKLNRPAPVYETLK